VRGTSATARPLDGSGRRSAAPPPCGSRGAGGALSGGGAGASLTPAAGPFADGVASVGPPVSAETPGGSGCVTADGSRAAGAAVKPGASSTQISVPTGTVLPSSTTIRPTTPSSGDGTSTLTLSVMTSTSGSSRATASPTCLSHRPMVPSVTDSPS
jgi:hypothetical protein